jgi:excisionase family DNA binding protein
MPKHQALTPAWRRLRAAALLCAALIGQVSLANAAEPAPPTADVLTLSEAAQLLRVTPEEVKRLASRNEVPARRIGWNWRFNRAALMAWLNGDWHLIAAIQAPAAPRQSSRGGSRPTPPAARLALTSDEMERMSGSGTRIAQASTGETERKPDEPGEGSIGEAPKERTAEAVFLRGQKVLLAPGEVTLDVGQFYSRSDAQQLASVGSGIGLGTVKQRAFTTFLQGRIGVLDETELFASATYRNQDSDVLLGSRTLASSDRSEFGDVRLGLRRTLLKEGTGRPNIIATLDARIPTGDTSYAVGGGLALVKSIDPVVLFANANYRHTFSRDFDDVTRLEPEDRLDVTLGYALALNDRLTISTSVSGVFSGVTRFPNATLRQQDTYSLSFGLTSWLAKGLYIEPTVSFGLSGPGSSVAFGVTVPYSF